MPISDAQFAARLLTNDPWTWVYEQDFAYGTSSVSVSTVRFASRALITEPSDTPASTVFYDRLVSVPNFNRELSRDNFLGMGRISVGDVQLANADGFIDWMLDLILDGREARFYLGAPGWPFTDYRHIFTALAERVEMPGRGRLSVKLRDRNLELDSAIVGDLIGGAGPNADRSAPVTLGYVALVEALVEDTANLVYRWAAANYIYDVEVLGVYDKGASLGPDGLSGPTYTSDSSTNRINITADPGLLPLGDLHVDEIFMMTDNVGIPGGLAVDTQYWINATDGDTWFTLSNTRGGSTIDITSDTDLSSSLPVRKLYYDNDDGTITLSNQPVGQVMVEASNNGWTSTGGSPAQGRPSDFLYWGARVAGGISAGNYLGAHSTYSVGSVLDDGSALSGIAVSERTNISDFLDVVAEDALAFWTSTRLGKFMYGRIRPDQVALMSGLSVMTFTDDDALDDDARLERLMPSYSTISGYLRLNYPPQTSLANAPTMTAERQAEVAGVGQVFASYEDTSTPSYPTARLDLWHTTMLPSPKLRSLRAAVTATSWLTDWAPTYQERLWPHIETLSFTASFRAYSLEQGDVVTVNMPKNCHHTGNTYWQVFGINLKPMPTTGRRLKSPRVGLMLVRRRVPNYTSSSH